MRLVGIPEDLGALAREHALKEPFAENRSRTDPRSEEVTRSRNHAGDVTSFMGTGGSDVLEDLRLLTNYAMDSDNRLCLVLVGHPELRRRLNMAVHEALSQRVVVRAHMPGLARDEVAPYLEHLLRLAGTELPLFEPSAQEALFQASSGLPRKFNLIAHHALLAAALAKAKSVTTEHLQSAMTETT